MLVFGPIPSRRLGYSLGINHIPPKHCSYSCVYCQVGRTTNMGTICRDFYPVDQIIDEVERKIADCRITRQAIDYLTLVPDGEPTLDRNMGKLIEGLRIFGIPIAVISNASLINQEDVQAGLFQADWVSLKVDAVDEAIWRQINRPHRRLSLSSILTGMLSFREKYRGELVTETMLVDGLNDSDQALHKLLPFLLELQPFTSYLSIPTRPPAEPWVRPPYPDSLQTILQTISRKVKFVKLLFESETVDIKATGNLIEDILSITAVHPLQEDALRHMVVQAGADWVLIEELISSHKIIRISYQNENFYLRRLGN